jgi:tripartite-type tricarboxylate transporter receptor subunit TctC
MVSGAQNTLWGVAPPNRMAALPQVPTIAQTLPGFESAAWFAIVAPPKTPAAVADKINADVNEALREADIRERLAQLSAEPIGGTPLATAAYMREEVERWHKVIKAANVKLE